MSIETESGIWKISTGKGNRIYIKCSNKKNVFHEDHLCSNNGLGIYGYGHLQDLASAILMFEKQKHKDEDESIINNQ